MFVKHFVMFLCTRCTKMYKGWEFTWLPKGWKLFLRLISFFSGCKDTVSSDTRWSCQTTQATTSTTTSIAATTQTTDVIRPSERRIPDATGTLT